MGWNHRVLRHPGAPGEAPWYAIHEVHYRSDEVDDLTVTVDQVGYTEQPVAVTGESVEALRLTLQRMLAALDKPVLDGSS